MFKLIVLMSFQSLFLVLAQVTLKLGLSRLVDKFSFSAVYLVSLVSNYYLWLTGIMMLLSGVIWIYVLRNYDFSQAYPLVSISYIFSFIVSIAVFHEQIPLQRWIGLIFIVVGVILIAFKFNEA